MSTPNSKTDEPAPKIGLPVYLLLQALLEHSPDRIYFKDAQSRFLMVNPAMAALFGFSDAQQIVGKSDSDFFVEEHAAQARRDEEEVMRTGKPLLGIVEEERRPNGAAAWASTTKLPLRDAAGTIIGTFGISRDVTDRKLAEQALEENNRQLEELARSEREALRRLQETQARLVQTEKMAGLGQLVAGVAHEINNPLSVATNSVAVLKRSFASLRDILDLYRKADAGLEAAQPELMRSIRELSDRIDLGGTLASLDEILSRSREGMRRIQKIVLDLREFARLDDSDLNEVDLNQAIELTANLIRNRATSQNVQIQLELQSLPRVECFPAKINEVIMNLINNGIDACNAGGHITIRSAPVNEQGQEPRVRIEIRDTGCGIEPAVKAKIFDPFFTTKPIGKGTGLGLSISYGVVHDHRGTIEVDSTPGQGACFIVTLPVAHRGR